MNSLFMPGIILIATYGLGAVVLAALVAVMWHLRLSRITLSAADLLAVRLFPAGGALLFAVLIVLPAFLAYEPHRDREAIGPWLLILAGCTLLMIGHGLFRGWRAWSAARSILKRCRPEEHRLLEDGHQIRVIDSREPVLAVIGGCRPEIVASESVISACTEAEFRQVVAHEAAHVLSRDNFKLLLQLMCPDVLAWTGLGTTMVERWRMEAEFAADQRAAGDDPHRRVELASALVKVARLFNSLRPTREALTMLAAQDDIDGRVRRLLAPAHGARSNISKALLFFTIAAPVAALPLYALLHELIETLVGLGL